MPSDNNALQWRHNGYDGFSNHQPHDCLLSRLFRHRSKKTSKLRVTGLCAGNSPGTGEFPAQMASNADFFPFDDVIMLRYDITITQWANGILLGVYLNIQSIHHVLVYKTHIPHYPGMDQRIWFKQFFMLWCKNLNRQQYMHMKNLFYIYHCNGVIKGAIASQITSLTIVYSSVYSDADKKNIKFPRHWPLCREFTGDRWIPRINGQLRGKCFHLMTSSWCLNNDVSPHMQ